MRTAVVRPRDGSDGAPPALAPGAPTASIRAMFSIPKILIAAALLGMPALVSAQQPGSTAPEFVIEKAWNDGPKSFDDLQGKVVILDFAQTW